MSEQKQNNYICYRCHTMDSPEWGKCCDIHTPLNSLKVVCSYCMKKLHPPVENPFVEHRNIFEEAEKKE